MHTPWIGARRVAVIPALVTSPQFDPPPADWADQIRRRIFYDPDPTSGIDRSLRTYVHTVSYGKALLEADVFNPVPVQTSHCGAMQDEAIATLPAGHTYEYACVVFTAGSHNCRGWAFYENPPFPGTSNLRHWCYVSTGEGLGVWAMELMHTLTGFGDLYQTTDARPGGFDNMDCACGTHPSAFTKLKLNWLDQSQVRTTAAGPAATITLHALALLQPSPPGRVAAIRIPSTISQHYFLVEARLRVDPYERQTPGISTGLPSEGVVVYEIDEAVWAPVHLRAVLTAGQSYTHQSEQLQISVAAQVPGGFIVTVQSTEHPDCPTVRGQIAEAEAEIRGLQEELQHAAPGEKAAIVAQIRQWRARLRTAQQHATDLGCRLR
jgi:hypothetical protein